MKIGIPNRDCVADFKEIRSSKLKKILKNASLEEETLGEYLFNLMLEEDIESDFITEYFI